MRSRVNSSRAALISVLLAVTFPACQSKIVHEIVEYVTTMWSPTSECSASASSWTSQNATASRDSP